MCRLLLLEDDRGLVDGLKYSLEKNGFDLDVARTVREARHALRGGHPYDLLLLDVTLPDGTGFMVCEEAHGPSDPYALESDTTGCRERPFQKAENICRGSGEGSLRGSDEESGEGEQEDQLLRRAGYRDLVRQRVDCRSGRESGEKRTRSYTERRACNCVLGKVPRYGADYCGGQRERYPAGGYPSYPYFPENALPGQELKDAGESAAELGR